MLGKVKPVGFLLHLLLLRAWRARRRTGRAKLELDPRPPVDSPIETAGVTIDAETLFLREESLRRLPGSDERRGCLAPAKITGKLEEGRTLAVASERNAAENEDEPAFVR
ncbi:hypothetical protein K0M31_014449 [Melipona bicolor]|uniref:Uncharacterized protein n=1 Tax=Melipona bicolor TaxID=60889 RepID=A0AA40G8U2_9HYME|nr:hypothetical protein K0M31_014449 [Melipona bicolor]